MPAPYRRCRWAKATIRSRSVAFRTGAGVYRNAERSPLSAKRLAGHLVLERRLRQSFLEPAILGLEFLQPLGVRDAHAAELAHHLSEGQESWSLGEKSPQPCDPLLDEAFIQKGTIDQVTYERQRDRVREELALAQLAASDAALEELDVESVMSFAETVLTDASRLWTKATPEQKQRLQAGFFPDGLRFDGNEFGTALTCWLSDR